MNFHTISARKIPQNFSLQQQILIHICVNKLQLNKLLTNFPKRVGLSSSVVNYFHQFIYDGLFDFGIMYHKIYVCNNLLDVNMENGKWLNFANNFNIYLCYFLLFLLLTTQRQTFNIHVI